MVPEQLTLDVRIHESLTFENYFAGENAECVSTLIRTIENDHSGVVYLWGKAGVGRSHLLQASCDLALKKQRRAFYLSLENISDLAPSILEGMDDHLLFCIDDLQKVAGDSNWERAIFNAYNNLMARKGIIFFAADNVHHAIGIELADLCSRLAAGATYCLHDLTDDEKSKALGLRAHEKGLELSEQVLKFMLFHCPRNLGELFAILDRLDQKSLDTKRPITIPLLKELLSVID